MLNLIRRALGVIGFRPTKHSESPLRMDGARGARVGKVGLLEWIRGTRRQPEEDDLLRRISQAELRHRFKDD